MLRPTPKRMKDPPPGCPLNACLKLLSGAWTPEILWYLKDGARRFGDLQRDLNGISAKVLTVRLRELEEKGVVAREVMPTRPPTVEYSLTTTGLKLNPVLDTIVEVGKNLKQLKT